MPSRTRPTSPVLNHWPSRVKLSRVDFSLSQYPVVTMGPWTMNSPSSPSSTSFSSSSTMRILVFGSNGLTLPVVSCWSHGMPVTLPVVSLSPHVWLMWQPSFSSASAVSSGPMGAAPVMVCTSVLNWSVTSGLLAISR